MRPIPIPTYTGEYRPIPDTGIGLTLVARNISNCFAVCCNWNISDTDADAVFYDDLTLCCVCRCVAGREAAL